MMKAMYVLYDRVLGSVSAGPFLFPASKNNGAVIREIESHVSKMPNVDDTDLYQLGVFNESTMEISPCIKPLFLIHLSDLKKPEQPK